MTLIADPALDAYEALAEHYDDFTARYDHDRWWAALAGLLGAHGWRGRRVLDAACGTGRSTLPLVAAGLEVTACDLSPAMVERARAALGPRVDVHVADVRELPPLGPFDLVTCLDDAVNYLVDDGALGAALASFARVLAPGGLLVFDANTTRVYDEAFARCQVVEHGSAFLCWRGEGRRAGRASATIEIFEPAAGGLWRRRASRHVQRHHTRDELRDALRATGFDVLAVAGQQPGCVLSPHADELRDTKSVYVARRREEGP